MTYLVSITPVAKIMAVSGVTDNAKIDANGNITAISSGTNDPDGKIAKENAGICIGWF